MPTGIVDVLGTGTVAGIVAGLLNHFLAIYRERGKLKRESKSLALRIAVALEGYAMSCGEAAEEIGNYETSDGIVGELHTDLPSPPEYPDKVDWSNLCSQLASRALTLPSEIRNSNATMAFYRDVIEPEDSVKLFIEESGFIGFRAWEIAKDLRERYGIERYKPTHTGFLELLHEGHERAAKRIADGLPPY